MTNIAVTETGGKLLVAAWANDGTLLPRSPEAEHHWLPKIGPTSYLLGCRLAVEMATMAPGATYAVIDLKALAGSLGISRALAANDPLVRSLDRLIDYGLARMGPDGWTYEIRTLWPPRRDRTASVVSAISAAS